MSPLPSARRITPPPVTALTFGCAPHTDDELTRSRLQELCNWLSARLGTHSFEAIRPSAFDRLREDIQMGRELGLL